MRGCAKVCLGESRPEGFINWPRLSVWCAHLPVLGVEERMAFTPNFRNVGSLAEETIVCGEPPRRLPAPGEPRSEAPLSVRAEGGPGLGGDRPVAVGTLRGR